MNKEGHVEVARVEHSRYAVNSVERVERTLNAAVGSENVDWWVKEYYEQQCSYVIFTVPRDLEQKAISALKYRR